MKKIIIISFLLGACAVFSFGQTDNFFKPVAEQDIQLPKGLMRSEMPVKYRTYQLDYTAIKAVLQTAPWEFTPEANAHTCVIRVPMADGTFEAFTVWQTAMMEPDMAAAHPDIRTFAGQSLRNKARGIRMSYSVRGLEIMVMQPDMDLIYVEPYSWNQDTYYIAYDRVDLPKSPLAGLGRGYVPGQDIKALTDKSEGHPYTPKVEERGLLQETVKLKVYRFVCACTAEFAIDHGGTKASALAAVVSYTNKVSGFFERDIDLRLQLIQASENAIFIDPANEPWTGQQVTDWMGQNPLVVNTYCGGSSAFDIGHVYARYITGGAVGVAGGIGIICGSGKARGCSGGNGNGDYGDYFLGVVGQELGHQLGGGHTWNRCNGGGGRNGDTAFEPGSGSTIMSYSGACGPDNIQNQADLYYHSGSIEEIQNYILVQGGSECGSFKETNNHAPVVTLPYQDNFFIPISTPFELKGSAVDAENGQDTTAITYIWEEIDAGPETPLGMPTANAATFRTKTPTLTGYDRTFPKLSIILTNQTGGTTAEVYSEQLPTYTRDLTFRLTGRDGKANGGGVGWADVAFHATSTAGPFKVLYPNASADIWHSGEYVNVTWDVANTNKAPVNCQTVNILLSLDGGLTFKDTLAKNVVNDGGQYVLVPDTVTSTARVRVEAADNIFFDLSNGNFKIQKSVQPSFTFGLSADAGQICLPSAFSADILSAGLAGFDSPVALDVSGNLPPGAVPTFSNNPILPGQPTGFALDLNNVHVSGTFQFQVRAIVASTHDTIVRAITLTLIRNEFGGFGLTLPPDGTSGYGLTGYLHWSKVPDALSYDIQLSKSPAFDSLLISATGVGTSAADSFKMQILLEKGQGYYWRMRPRNLCGVHEWTEPFFFSTYSQSCQVFQANDLPLYITGSDTVTVYSKITVISGGPINDINVKSLKGYHDAFTDLEVALISPTGTTVNLFKKRCGNTSVQFSFGLDDESPAAFYCPPPNNGAVMRPVSPLAAFIGQNSTGAWTLRVRDDNPGSGGSIDDWKVEFCAAISLQPPYLVNNNTLNLDPGTNKEITNDLLLTEDPNNTHDQLVYTLVTVPHNGQLTKNFGGAMKPGDQFTQSDIDNHGLRYYDYGNATGPDGFRFVVTDNEGGFVATPLFTINTIPTATHEAADLSGHFVLFPNPADEAVWVAFDRTATTVTRVSLFDAGGRLVSTSVLPAGSDRIRLVTADLAKGMYAVRVETEQAVGVRKLMVH
jgi:subtilisin-like proprotein convertase family protein